MIVDAAHVHDLRTTILISRSAHEFESTRNIHQQTTNRLPGEGRGPLDPYNGTYLAHMVPLDSLVKSPLSGGLFVIIYHKITVVFFFIRNSNLKLVLVCDTTPGTTQLRAVKTGSMPTIHLPSIHN